MAFPDDTAQRLHAAIAAVCPIDGIAIGDPRDKRTWRIDFRKEATADHQAAALMVVEDFRTDAP